MGTPVFEKHIGRGFLLDLELELGLGEFDRSLGWEARFPAFKGRRFSNPGSVGQVMKPNARFDRNPWCWACAYCAHLSI